MAEFWTEFLYRPVFNALIWIYNNWTDMSMGWAVVYLTILLRLALLPFTIVDERNKAKNMALFDEIKDIEKGYKDDPILMKEEVRRALKKRRVQPWAKAVVLGIQALVFVLLYQVFVQGTNGERMAQMLYAAIDFPAIINVDFYGFDISASHDYFWSGLVAIWIAMEIYLGLRRRKTGVDSGDLAYFVLFPLFIFLFLWFLPMVKAIFILTSTVFSAIVNRILRIIFTPKKKPTAS